MMTGMSATVSILTDSKKNILILPIDAIFSKNERRYVFIESLKGLMEQDIQVGIVNEDYAEILMGLKEKDIVLVPIQDSMLFNNSGNSSGTTPRFPMMPGPSNHSNPFNQP
jgi:HlyD family secretion protein